MVDYIVAMFVQRKSKANITAENPRAAFDEYAKTHDLKTAEGINVCDYATKEVTAYTLKDCVITAEDFFEDALP